VVEKVVEKIVKVNNSPDPTKYSITRSMLFGGYLILQINYPDCDNYEGNKILVFDCGVTLEDLKKQKSIDPHFSSNKRKHSPIARFEPTDRGWGFAVLFVSTISDSAVR
jgi:hypothetical protein